MERRELTAETFTESVGEAARVLTGGGVILYPTDTLYGLGADAFSSAAVGKIRTIKGRSDAQPISCVVADIAMAEAYVEIPPKARRIMEKFLPGALTIILTKRAHVKGGIAEGMETIGIRIPDSDFCSELARTFGRPFTATSANRAGVVPASDVDAICAQLGEGAALIDCAIDAGTLLNSVSSTVVRCSEAGEIEILREGKIPGRDILAL